MYGNHDTLQRILVLADVYFRLTGKSAGAMSGEEMEEFYAYTAQCSAPEELHNLIKIKINPGKDRKSTRLNSSHIQKSRMPSSA